jgi:hypothetical protein
LAIKEVADGVEVYEKGEITGDRPVIARSLGCHLKGSLLPHADTSDPHTLADGVRGRMGRMMPDCKVDKAEFLAGMKEFVLDWLIKNMKPIQFNEDMTFETWLENTNYPEWRKDELRLHQDKIANLLERNKYGELMRFTIKLFMKDEFYVKFAQGRGIYAREDNAKIFFGPWVKQMEHEMYKHPAFIKHVPVKDRPSYIYSRLYRPGGKYVATDYSAFENHFRRDLMMSCEFVLYEYLLANVNGARQVLDIMEEVWTGKNRVFNKYVKCEIDARRMSGEMNTSLGNGFSNLMFMSYICKLEGIEEPIGVVEGDDGLFVFVGKNPTTEMFTNRGFNIKLELHEEICTASFCGNIFDETDQSIVTDPYDVISCFGWTTHKYANSGNKTLMKLLRAKSMSLAYQYPGCPILGALAQYGLRVTRSYTVGDFIIKRKEMSMYEREKILKMLEEVKDFRKLYEEPGINTRLLFERLYGIPVSTQTYIEEYLNSLNTVQELDIPLLSDYVPRDWQLYYKYYVDHVDLDLIPQYRCFLPVKVPRK